MNDAQLLREFAVRKSETAFRSLVERHLPLVFGTARRVTQDSAMAEDIAQTVFLLLAQKASKLSHETILSGWLYQTTRFVCSRALRGEQRRRKREETAIAMHLQNAPDPQWQRVAPHLDEALARLNETDRHAILLRFFQGERSSAVGVALGLSEEAAKKRVARALEKLRRILSRDGTELSLAVVAAGLSYEASAAVPGELASTIAAGALAHLSAGAGVTTGSALLGEVLASLKWGRIKLAAGIIGSVLLLGIFLNQAIPNWRSPAPLSADSLPKAAANRPATQTRQAGPLPGTIDINGEIVPLQTIKLTVLDAQTDAPIPNARVTHTLMQLPVEGEGVTELRTGPDGVLELHPPERVPGMPQDLSQFQASVTADDYAPREIMWLCSTGGVLGTLTPEYTVRLEHGITIGGLVVNDSGQPLSGVKLRLLGNSYQGYSYSLDSEGRISSPPEIRAEDFPSYSTPSERGPGAKPCLTDAQGRFQVNHFPSDLKSLSIDLTTPEGAHHKFITPQGSSLTAETLPFVEIAELRAGTARIVLERGVDVRGKVIAADGGPVAGAEIIEARMLGNLQVLSRGKSDEQGAFSLVNRKPREILLSAFAPGHGSVSRLVTIREAMAPVRLELPPELPLRGRVTEANFQPIAGANVVFLDYRNDGLALEWKDTTDQNGGFEWRGAPTNALVLFVSANGFAPREIRLRASAETHSVVLHPGPLESISIAGQVGDSETGEPIKTFQVKVHTMDNRVGSPGYLRQTVPGMNGQFQTELNFEQSNLHQHDALVLVIEAAGYETLLGPPFYIMEGDQQLTFKIQRGGTIEGVILAPDGSRAEKAQFATIKAWDGALASDNGLLSRKLQESSDATGAFHFQKPLGTTGLVVFHESGWAIEPLPFHNSKMTIQLRPWAKIDVTLDATTRAANGDYVAVDSLILNPPQRLQILYHTAADTQGHYVFPRVPAGEFTVSIVPAAPQKYVQSWMHTLETNVAVQAGETKTMQLACAGNTVTARLKLAGSPSGIVPVLSREVSPSRSGLAYYASYASLDAATSQWGTDPSVLEGRRAARSYYGVVSGDGLLTFHGVPPGRYTLEVKQFGPDAQLRRNIEVSEAAGEGEEVDLGVLCLDGK